MSEITREVTLTVAVTVKFPDGAPDTSADMAKAMAMSAVTPFHEVDCGEVGRVRWAKVYAEVSDDECEVLS